MEILCIFPDKLGYRGQKGDHIVVDFCLYLIDAVDIEVSFFLDRFERRHGNNLMLGHGAGGLDLNLQPGFELGLVSPECPHLRQCISCNHWTLWAFL